MTAPGDSTEVGSIVAYLYLQRQDWTRGVNETERDAAKLGQLSPSIHIDDNSAAVIGHLALVDAAARKSGTALASNAQGAAKPVLSLVGALALIAPAAAPIGAVAGGAILGLIPTLAAGVVGVKGIVDEFKSGQLEGTSYGDTLGYVGDQFDRIQQTASIGLLDGINRGVAQSGDLFGELNDDLGLVSVQLGDIVSTGGPALVGLLHQLNPLFLTFGDLVTHGADALNKVAQGDGLSGFVDYAQAQLPIVAHDLGQIITLLAHLAEGSQGAGHEILVGLGSILELFNALPIDLLRVAIPLVVSLRLAMLAYRGVDAVIAAAGRAWGGLTTRLEASRAAAGSNALAQSAAAHTAQAAALEVRAAAAAETAAVQKAKAAEARAALEASAVITASTDQLISLFANEAAAVEGAAAAMASSQGATASLFATEAEAAQVNAGAVVRAEEAKAVAATEYAATAQRTAAQATAAAARTSAAATAAAEKIAVESKVARVGWASMLGPLAALAVGISFLAGSFDDESSHAQDAADAQQSYADSVKESTDALNSANVAQTNKNLSDKGALSLLDELHHKGGLLNVSYADLTEAVNGGQEAFDRVQATLKPYLSTTLTEFQQKHLDSAADAKKLFDVIETLRGGLQSQIITQTELNDINAKSLGLTSDQAVEGAKLYHLVGEDGVAAYLSAKQAASQNTDQTKAQTLAFQLENNAAGLLNQALLTLSGQYLGIAEAQTRSVSASHTFIEALEKNKGAITGQSNAALLDQAALQQKVEADRALAETVAKQTGSNDKAVESYKRSKESLEGLLRKHHQLTPEMQAYIDKLYAVKSVSDYLTSHPTDIDVKDRATKKLQAMQKLLETLAGKAYSVHVTASGDVKIAGAGPGGTTYAGHFAEGGPVNGPGDPRRDSLWGHLRPGEWVMPPEAREYYGDAFMQAVRSRSLTLPGAGKSMSNRAASGQTVHVGKLELHLDIPEALPPGEAVPLAMAAATAEIGKLG